ncbi:MAG: hypothetical protein PWP23_213, partial [Candidatus Sumerlaeota bacterium]|nr:hypothetical protein [Candidatus Sumerlaeota bacterium]
MLGALAANFSSPPLDGADGATFLFEYNPDNFAGPFLMSEFDESFGIRLDGTPAEGSVGGAFGEKITSGFDFNGDGFPDAVVAATRAYEYEGEISLVYGFDGPTSLTIRRYIAPGDAPRAGVGMLGDGSHTIPHSRLWIDFGSGDDGNGGASLMTATIRRNLDGLSNLPGPAASVHWIGEWDRPGWDGANITLKYLGSEVAGLNPARLRLYYSESPDGPWTESQHPLIDTRKKRIGGVVWSKGYYVLIEKPLASGDVNKDGGVTPADAQDAFDCSIGA